MLKEWQQGDLHLVVAIFTIIATVVVCFAVCATRRRSDSRYQVRKAIDFHHRVAASVMRVACPYDPEENLALRHFLPVKSHSNCLFSKAARLWGSADWDTELSLENNVRRSIPMFVQFCMRSEIQGEKLDGFLFEIKGQQYGRSPKALGDAVRRLLLTIDETDPAGFHCMRKNYIGKVGWVFRYANSTFFMTTFAPCYGLKSSRHAFGVHPDSSFVLLQPESTFLHHQLPPDDPSTRWQKPVTIRDRIRRSFRDAGRAYYIPESVVYPAAEHVVRPLGDEEEQRKSVIRWWESS